MNKRIRELATEADVYCDQNYLNHPDPHYQDNYTLLWEQKFAELIVRDISQMIESQDVDPAFKHRMSWVVKDRYGVE